MTEKKPWSKPFMFHIKHHKKNAFTLLEMLISSVLLIMLGVMMTYGMIAHARTSQSNYSLKKITDEAMRLTDAIQGAAIDCDTTGMSIAANAAGVAGTVLTISKTDESGASVNLKQYAYIDRDGNPDTILDNVIVERNVNQPTATTGKVIAQNCSPINSTTPIFTMTAGAKIQCVRIALRVGDRTNPPSEIDNGNTGRGYQSFVINTYVSSLAAPN